MTFEYCTRMTELDQLVMALSTSSAVIAWRTWSQSPLPLRHPILTPRTSRHLTRLDFSYISHYPHHQLAMSAAAAKGKAKEKPLASLLAGATAGGIESFITFPLESLKTQLQFGALEGGKVRDMAPMTS